MNKENECCANCIYGYYFEIREEGACRRYPPTITVHESDWCGEYKEKNKKKKPCKGENT